MFNVGNLSPAHACAHHFFAATSFITSSSSGVRGGLAFAFLRIEGGCVWRWLALMGGLGTFICLAVFLPSAGLVNTALAISGMFFLAAGGLGYAIYRHYQMRARVIRRERGEPRWRGSCLTTATTSSRSSGRWTACR